MRSRKGIAIGINALVVIIIALIVLVVISGYFFGGFGTAGGGVSEIGTGAICATEEQTEVEGSIDKLKDLWGTS